MRRAPLCPHQKFAAASETQAPCYVRMHASVHACGWARLRACACVFVGLHLSASAGACMRVCEARQCAAACFTSCCADAASMAAAARPVSHPCLAASLLVGPDRADCSVRAHWTVVAQRGLLCACAGRTSRGWCSSRSWRWWTRATTSKSAANGCGRCRLCALTWPCECFEWIQTWSAHFAWPQVFLASSLLRLPSWSEEAA